MLSCGVTPPSIAHLVSAFCAGFLAVLVFHQPMLGLLHAAGVTPATPYPMQPTAPWGVPELWSLAFWGGVWGLVFGLVVPAARSPGRYIATGLNSNSNKEQSV